MIRWKLLIVAASATAALAVGLAAQAAQGPDPLEALVTSALGIG